MFDDLDVPAVLGIAACILLVGLIVGAAMPQRVGSPRRGEGVELRYPLRSVVQTWVTLPFMSLLFAAALVGGPMDAPWFVLLVVALGGFVVIILLLAVTVTRVRYEVGGDGIRYVSPLTRARFLAWSDVARVRYHISPVRRLFFYPRDGKRMAVSPDLTGLAILARFALERLPANDEDCLDDQTREFFDALAEKAR